MSLPNWAQAVLNNQTPETIAALRAHLAAGDGVLQCCRTVDGVEVCVSIESVTECAFDIKT